jgi:hypothetical protein
MNDGYQSKFIRQGEFVNFPNANSGYDGDTHISLELDDDIRRLVTPLIEEAERWREEATTAPEAGGCPFLKALRTEVNDQYSRGYWLFFYAFICLFLITML